MKIILIILALIIFYLFMIYPNNSRKDKMIPFHNVYICHRGLFNNKDIPENSLIAFKKAVDNNYGIELDVQITADDKLVVFHDTSLYRMTNIEKDLNDCTFSELQEYPLLDTKHTIPLFEDVLKLLKPDTPLIIEVKEEKRYIQVTKMLVELMKDYDGLYNMESFNPIVVEWLKSHAPNIIRGQLSYNYLKDKNNKNPFIIKFLLTYLLTNILTRPDYVAYDYNSLDNISFKIISKIFKGECVAWTIKSQKDLENAKEYYQTYIFDSFIPK